MFNLRDFILFLLIVVKEILLHVVSLSLSLSCPQSRRNVGIASKRFGLATSQSV